MTLDGFPYELEFEGKTDGLKGIIERLKAIGAVLQINSLRYRHFPPAISLAAICTTDQ
jgi:hypothetical protein